MKSFWVKLSELDRATYRTIVEFLDGRLEEREAINWALQLKPDDTIKRLALLDVVNSPAGHKIVDPWRSVWRLIEESWNNPIIEDIQSSGPHNAQQRIYAGERSGTLIATIVKLVAPQIRVKPCPATYSQSKKQQRRPKTVEDLVSTVLTSGKVIDPGELGLQEISESSFLMSLALALDAAVMNGFDIARRIGWEGESHFWKVGFPHRVYYVSADERTGDEQEPDISTRGFAPSVKLLYATVSRLVDLDISSAMQIIRRWKSYDTPIYLRLWAALSRDARVTPADEVGVFLLSLDKQRFWDLRDYPEVAELRAKRFDELEPSVKADLICQMKKLPPRNIWRKDDDADQVKEARLFWAIRELRRIEVAGGTLPKSGKQWMESHIHDFPDLTQMTQFDEGFSYSFKVSGITPKPADSRYDLLVAEERLKVLETSLKSTRRNWENDLAERASAWINRPANYLKILMDLESTDDGGNAYPQVWERFGWTHSPAIEGNEGAVERDSSVECRRVLSLLKKLHETTIRHAIRGICHWLSTWKGMLVLHSEGLDIWSKIWPIAMEVTNSKQPEEKIKFDMVVQPQEDHESKDLDTLNSPIGKLIDVFFAACPKKIRENERPFDSNDVLHRMRTTVIGAIGRSESIVKYRMIEFLPYFLYADTDWAKLYLIAPLITDDAKALSLWRAIARRTQFVDVLKVIGEPMSERASDLRLGRETRRSLVFSLVIECLHAYKDAREPAVPRPRIQQMIRTLDDEVRAYGAEAIQLFVRDVSVKRDGATAPPSPEELFQTCARPFLQEIWPQERSLATPGVSRALANLPATAKEAFADAVDTIERFLVPFDCWSMLDFGLYGEDDGVPKLSFVDSHDKAFAFLRLLDNTIGTAEGSVIPFDLADALDQIRRASPSLSENQIFRRLATAARRS